MMLQVITFICITAPQSSSSQLPQWLGYVNEAAQQTAGQLMVETTNQFAKVPEDFVKFTDKSQQLQRNFTLEEVAQCMGQNGGCLYIIFDGRVLDLSDFVPHHAGGSEVLLKYAGCDATAAMLASGMPTTVFDSLLQKFVIGNVITPKRSQPTTPTALQFPTTGRSSRAADHCGWLASCLGFCDYIVRFEKLYDEYKALTTEIFAHTRATYNMFAQTNNVTALT